MLDALIALAILAFGLLGMTHMQANLVRQASEGQSRLLASQLADELLSTVLVDVGNATCYTYPAEGACGSTSARARGNDWYARAVAALPGTPTAAATLADNRLTVTLSWTGKAAEDARNLEMTTDVRP